MSGGAESLPPKLSILLLCWNHARFLETCIESIARQEPGAEIVFLDNASTDGSFELARSLFDRFGLTAKLLRNDAPQSIPANFNRLLKESSGEIVAVLSTDDWYEPDYIRALCDTAAAHPDAGWFSCSGWLYFDAEKRSAAVDEKRFVTDRPVGEVFLEGGEPHFFVGCAYRRTALEAVGGWDEKQLIEDRDLFLRLAERFDQQQMGQRLVHYRRHSMASANNPPFMIEGWERFFSKHSARFGKRLGDRRAEMYRSYAALSVDRGELRQAARLLAKSLRLRPMKVASYRTLGYWIRRSAGASRGHS